MAARFLAEQAVFLQLLAEMREDLEQRRIVAQVAAVELAVELRGIDLQFLQKMILRRIGEAELILI